jgi:hypothetical protein
MSVPFVLSVAIEALEIAIDPALDAHAKPAALERRIRKQHPLLIAEHREFVQLIVQDASKLAAKIGAGTLSQADALVQLEGAYHKFPRDLLKRTITHALANLNSEPNKHA